MKKNIIGSVANIFVSFSMQHVIFNFRILTSVFPSAACVVKVVEGNRKMWVKMNHKVQQLQLVSNSSMDVLQLELGVEEEHDTDKDDSIASSSIAKSNGQISTGKGLEQTSGAKTS